MTFLVVNNEFNRVNYPKLIGQVLHSPPGYAHVKPVDTQETSVRQVTTNNALIWGEKNEPEKDLDGVGKSLGHGLWI